jgi:hypothetical protein
VTFDQLDTGLLSNSSFGQQHLAASSSASQPSFDGQIDFASGSQSLFPDHSLSNADPSGLDFGAQGSNAFPDFTNFDPTAAFTDPSFDEPLFSNSNDSPFSLSSSVVDPILLGSQENHHPSVTSGSPMNNMATHTLSPTPPHHLAPGLNRQSSASPHTSPAMGQGPFQPPPQRHSRNSSLDPSSAAFPQMQGPDWGATSAFQGHRRTYSDAHSDVSSAHASPYLATHDNFDGIEHSPHLNPQDPVMFQEVMGISHVSLAEANPSYISPAHSPLPSPRMLPSQQHLGQSFPSVDPFNLVPGMIPTMGNQFNGQGNHMFPPNESFPQLNQSNAAEHPGHADAMTPPEINIQLAPPSRVSSFEPQNQVLVPEGALSPPERRKYSPQTRNS